jgi:hypothetical protein
MVGENQFCDDPIKVFEDPEMNIILLKAMSGTHTRIGDLFVMLYKHKVTYCPENGNQPWYLFDATSGSGKSSFSCLCEASAPIPHSRSS